MVTLFGNSMSYWLLTIVLLFFCPTLIAMKTTSDTCQSTHWNKLPIEMKFYIIKFALSEFNDFVTVARLSLVNKELKSIINSDTLQRFLIDKSDKFIKECDKRNTVNVFPRKIRLHAWSAYDKLPEEEVAIKYEQIVWLKNYYARFPCWITQLFPYTPLHVAAATDAIRVAKYLNANYKNTKLNALNKDNDTPLLIATHYNSFRVVQFLLQRMTAEEKGKENIPLLFTEAAKHRDKKIHKLLDADFKQSTRVSLQ